MEAVRVRLTPREDPEGRSLDEQLLTRFPPLSRLAGRALDRLPVRSRLRRATATRLVRRMYAAFNRGDYELVYSLFDADVEIEIAESVSPLGFGPVLRGRDEVVSEWRRWIGDWEAFRRDPVEFVDLGDRVAVHVKQTARNRGSGADLENHLGHVFTLREGRVVHQKEYDEWSAAQAAVGLAPGPGA